MHQVSEMTFDYTDCEKQTLSASSNSLNLVDMPNYSYRLRSADAKNTPSTPQFAFLNATSSTDTFPHLQCVIQFQIVADLHPSVLMYYKLTNFFQNHRRYVKSSHTGQLLGQAISASSLSQSDCKPLAVQNNMPIYPCGLIANSLFNGKHLLPVSSDHYQRFNVYAFRHNFQSHTH